MANPRSNEIALVDAKVSRRALARQTIDHSGVALLEFQSPTAALIAQPVPFVSRMITWIMASMLAALLLLLGLVRVDQVVTTPGSVIATTPNVVLQPLETSIVRSIDVREGQLVHKGQLLAALDPTFAAGDDKSTTAQQSSLKAEVNRLRAELTNKPYVSDGTPYGNVMAQMDVRRRGEYQNHVDGLRQKVAAAQSKVQQFQANARSATDRLVGLRDVEARRSELERLQVGSHLNTLAARDARLQMEGTLADSQTAASGAKQELDGAIADLADYINQWHSETFQQLATQERLLSEMSGQATRNTLRRQLVELRAQTDAIVLSIARVSVGSVLQSGDEFIRMVPADSPLEIEAQVAATDAGFIKIGDPTTIKFDTLPYMQYGTASGKVTYISPDSFTDPNQGKQLARPVTNAAATTPGQATFFKTRVSIDRMQLIHVPASFRLTPGMPVTGDVKVGDRSVLQYFLARVAPTFTEGMREP